MVYTKHSVTSSCFGGISLLHKMIGSQSRKEKFVSRMVCKKMYRV